MRGPIAEGAVRAHDVLAMEGLAREDRLLAWLRQRVRYTGVSFGDSPIVPQPPAETLRREQGDCKDQATLLVALLRAAGIESRVALVRTRPGPDVRPELPGLGPFDRAVVYAPGDPDLWVDPAAGYSRAGELPFQTQGRLALIAGQATKGLMPTPVSEAEANRVEESVEIFLSELGLARIVSNRTYRGTAEIWARQSFSGFTTAEQQRRLEYLAADYGTENVVDWAISPPEDLS